MALTELLGFVELLGFIELSKQEDL